MSRWPAAAPGRQERCPGGASEPQALVARLGPRCCELGLCAGQHEAGRADPHLPAPRAGEGHRGSAAFPVTVTGAP